MELTKKQRKEVYLRAVEYFNKIHGKNYGNVMYVGFCDYLERYENEQNCNRYIEYKLFKPKKRMCEFQYWFDAKKEDKSEQTDRINALLLAAEMCND